MNAWRWLDQHRIAFLVLFIAVAAAVWVSSLFIDYPDLLDLLRR